VWSFSARPRTPDEIVGQRAVKLDRMRALLRSLGDPQSRFASLLVAGTKGKGSTVAMLAACLHAAGSRTGRYTSPHLVNWRERTWVSGSPISAADVVALAEPVRLAVESLPAELGRPTTFEVGTAFSFVHFAQQRVQVAVLECGVGGRYDATNVVEPLVSAITPISYDHTATLGSTLASIADHKAGVLRPDKPAVIGRQPAEALEVIQRIAGDLGTPLEQVGRNWHWIASDSETLIESHHASFEPLRTRVGLLGDHQRDNATTAVAVLHALGESHAELRVGADAMRAGLQAVEWPGRMQLLQSEPMLLLDGAHNAFSAEVLATALQRDFKFNRLLLVLGLSEGKDVQGVLKALGPRAEKVHLTRSHHERSADPKALALLAHGMLPETATAIHPDLSSAVEAALAEARADDLVLVTGSLFLVGEALVWWNRSPR
jgi:dihydrofolate synthase/folylpolyglutamate synthase